MTAKTILLLAALAIAGGCRQQISLQQQISDVCREAKATVGVAVLTEEGVLTTVNDTVEYAMMSTFKLPIAMAVLERLERHGTPLDTLLFVGKEELLPGTYSPLREKYPEGDRHFPVRELLHYSIALSDNNACDILLRFAGGTDAVQRYIEGIGITGMHIAVTEEEMHADRQAAYRNRTRPSAAVQLIDRLLHARLFTPAHREFIEHTLAETSTGSNKLRGMLPGNATVGHKTGSSDRVGGVKLGDNDMGFVVLPDGRRYAIAVFIMDSREDDAANASLIARISRLVYDHYLPETAK